MIALTVTTDVDRLGYFQKTTMPYLTVDVHVNVPNIGLVPALQALYERQREAHDILCFMHDDVEIHESGWAERVREEFDDPKVAIVGLGGAMGIGLPDIYKLPYHIHQLQRIDYYSNQRGWQIHGKLETGSRGVAVIDGFFMAVRTAFLKQIGGFAWMQTAFHNYDNALCLSAIERGHKVKMVGIDCTHYGGGTSTKAEYIEWCRERGTTPEREHQEPHVWLYQTFRNTLPYRVP